MLAADLQSTRKILKVELFPDEENLPCYMSLILRKPFSSISIREKVKFDEARCPLSTFFRL